MTRHVYVDETKARGYVLAAVTVTDPAGTRKTVRGLVRSGNRRLHMVDERPARRPEIVAELVTVGIEVTIYDAVRRYRTDREARAACLAAMVTNLAAAGDDTHVVLEEDRTLLGFDQQRLIEAIRANGLRGRLRYDHVSAYAEPLLALPDVAAWCWVRSGVWRRSIESVVRAVHTV